MAMYLTRAELAQIAPAGVVARFPAVDLDAAIAAASDEADGYLRARYALPLAADGWGSDLRQHVGAVALWRLLGQANYNPQAATNAYRVRYEDALRWLAAVRDGKVVPARIDDADAGTGTTVARWRVYTNPRRGW